MRELNPSGFLAPSLRLLSRLLFVLVLAGSLSEFGFECRFEAPGSGKAHGPGNSFIGIRAIMILRLKLR